MFHAARYWGVASIVLVLAAPLTAQEKKPVAVVSIASQDKLLAAGNELTKIVGMPLPATPEQMFEGMIKEMTKGKGLPGLDKTKPFGAVVYGADEADVLMFGPLGKLKDVLAALPEDVQKEDGEDGTTRVKLPNKPWAHVKGAGGWVYASPAAAALKDLPADPTALLGDLPDKYLMSVRIKVPNLDERMRKDLERELNQMPEEAAAKFKMLIEQLDEVTIGWKVDAAGKQVVAELTTTALEGSQLAGLAPRLADRPTRFAGLRSADAAISFCSSIEGALTPAELEEVKTAHDAALKRALEEIDDQESIPAESKPVIKEAISTLLAVWFDTAKSGIRDGGLAVLAKPDPAVVLGGYVSDGDSVAVALKRLGTLIEGDPSVPEIKWDAGEHGGYKLHTMKMDAGPAGEAIGGDLQIAAAIKKESVLLAAGKDAMTAIKKVIDGGAGTEKVPAVAFTLRANQILEMAGKLGPPNPMLKGLQAQLAALPPGSDEASVQSVPLDHGVMFRLTLREGAIKAIAMGATMAQEMAQPKPAPGGFEAPPGLEDF